MRRLIVAGAFAIVVAGTTTLLALRGDGEREPPATIDDRNGAYRGIAIGASPQDVLRMLGEPSREPGFAPAGRSPADVGVPQSIPGRGAPLRYDDVAFLAEAGRGVYAIMVTEEGAATTRGVAIGDNMDEAHEAYELRCLDVAGGESLLGGQEFYPSCHADTDGLRIWFGRDPIRSITIVSSRNSP